MDQNDGMSLGRGRPIGLTEVRRPLGISPYANPEIREVGNAFIVYPENICPSGIEFSNGPVYDPAGMMRSANVARMVYNPPNTGRSSTLSPFAKEFVPRNFRPDPQIISTEVCVSSVPEEAISMPDSYAVQELRSFLNDITMCPGKFENRIQHLTNKLNSMVEDDDTMRAIVNTIFDESVRQPNLRYSGARLCKSLCNDLDASPDRLNFRPVLLTRCNQEIKRREALAQAEDNGTYLRGFAMFMAELFSQLEVSAQKITALGDTLPSLIKTILRFSSPDNLKCACQVLKLVGSHLEDYERSKKNGTAPEMDSIVSNLKSLANGQEITRNIRDLINSVIKLRDTNWGRGSSQTENTSYESAPPVSDDPVMYGPDGAPMTADELNFLHSQYASINQPEDDYENIYSEENDELTDELYEAYEIFLQEQNNGINH